MKSRRQRFAAAAVVAPLLYAGTALATTPAEYAVTTKDRGPLGIVAGPDGGVWFAESAGGGGIGRIAPGGAITEYTTGLSSPAAYITLGPDGNLWFTEPAGRVGKITTAGTITEYTLPGGDKPGAIAAGSDGNLWFTLENGAGEIGRISTAGTGLVEFTAGLSTNGQPHGIAAGPDGNLWFTEAANPGRIGRITTSGTINEYTAGLTSSAQPGEIAAGPDGNLWFTERAGTGRIGRITTSGTINEFSTGLTPSSEPFAIAAGNDGNVYFTEAKNPGRIGRITPSGTITETATPTTNSQPEGIVTGPDGNVWFTEIGNHGVIGKLTVAPGVAARAPSSVSETTATLAASVDPNAQATEYSFEYGPTASYGSHTEAAAMATGSAFATVTSNITGLSAASGYHYRVVATNLSGTSYGPDQAFTTTRAPGAATGQASAVTLTAAALNGTVNPNSQPVSYRFEWGPTSAYGSATAEEPAGADSSEHPLTASISSLSPDTAYHFRIAATNCGWCTEGTTYGADQTFTSAKPPTAVTGGASAIGTSSATLSGTVDPDGAPTTYSFEWGETTAYGHRAPVPSATVGADSSEHQVSQQLTGLAEGTSYHYRLVASNCEGCTSGTTAGADHSFHTTGATLMAPLAAPPAQPTSKAAPPQIGRTALVRVERGVVLVRTPGSAGPRPLSAASDIPVGSLVLATGGTLTLTTATDASGHTQTATVWGGDFRFTQSAGNGGMTTMTLAGAQRPPCGSARRAHASRRTPHRPQTLWAKDNHGHFSTRGNNSVATVRGTWWGTEERCRGTLTIVREGLVSVRPRHGRSVLVRAGHSYLARS